MKKGRRPWRSSARLMVFQLRTRPSGRLREPSSGPLNSTLFSRSLLAMAAMSGGWTAQPMRRGSVMERVVDDFALRGIGSDDFQVAAFTERKQSVACAAAGVNSADSWAHAGGLFDEFDAAIEIAAAEKDVIEQSGHVIVVRVFGALGQGNRRNGKSAPGEREKTTARKSW